MTLISHNLDHKYCDRHLRTKRIGRLAELKWRRAGRPIGRDLEFWVEAESEYEYMMEGLDPDVKHKDV